MIKLEGISTYLNEIKLAELEAGGVDNWPYYGDSIWEYRENCEYDDEDELTAEETLIALENGGVDNWTFYDESLSDYCEYEEYVETQDELGASEVMDFYEWQDDRDTSDDVEDMTFEEWLESDDEDHERRTREMMKPPLMTIEEWLESDEEGVPEEFKEDLSSFKFPLLYKHLREKLSTEDDDVVLRAYFDTVRSLANNFNTFAPRLIKAIFIENKLPHKLSEDEFIDEVLPVLVEKAVKEEEQITINFILIIHGFELK